MPSIDHFRRRMCRRMIRDLPIDLADEEALDPLGLLRGRVLAEVKRTSDWNRGAALPRRSPSFSVPSSPSATRQTSAHGERTFHFSKNKTADRTADAFDSYASRKCDDLETGQVAVARPAPAFDDYTRSHGVGENGLITTLDPDPGVRGEQWRIIEAHERGQRAAPDGGPPRINVRYDEDPLLMDRVAYDPRCPTGLREVILLEAKRSAEESSLSASKQMVGVPWIDAAAPATIDWIDDLDTSRKAHSAVRTKLKEGARSPAFKLSLGRACQTVIAGDGELPKQLDAAARRRILEGLRAFITTVAAANAAKDAVVPLVLVEHAPDELNNPNNHHFHWQMGCRTVSIEKDGSITFASSKVHAFTRRDWLVRMRGEIARLTNLELAAIDAGVRFHPGTNEDIGIATGRIRKLSGTQTVLERAGVPTPAGIENAAEGWRRAFEKVQADCDLSLSQARMDDSRWHDSLASLSDERRRKFEAERAKALEEIEQAARLRHEAAQIDIFMAMTRSRAEETSRFGPGYQRKAAAKKSDESYDARGWRAKVESAKEHLSILETELREERIAVLARMREAVALEARAAERLSTLEQVSAGPLEQEDERHRHSTTLETAVSHQQQSGVVSALSPHRAVDIIASEPLLVSKIGASLLVDPADDHRGLVEGVDLTTVQARLAGIRASQRRELRQLAAYATKHGVDSLSPEALRDADAWIQTCAAKWRAAPVFHRLLDHARSVGFVSDKPPVAVEPGNSQASSNIRAGVPSDEIDSDVFHRVSGRRQIEMDAFDKVSGQPTRALLTLLRFAGQQPTAIGLAADGRMTNVQPVPPAIRATIDQWRGNANVHALIGETIENSRAVGRPVYPERYAKAINALGLERENGQRRMDVRNRGLDVGI